MRDYLVLLTSDDNDDVESGCKQNDPSSSTYSVSSVGELLSWTQEHITLLSNSTTTLLVKTQWVAQRLQKLVDDMNEEIKRIEQESTSVVKHTIPSFEWKLNIEVLLLEEEQEHQNGNSLRKELFVWDLILVSKILSLSKVGSTHSVLGVFYFPGTTNSLASFGDSKWDNVARICQYVRPTIPLATNRATSSLCVKSMFYTRVAYVIFNPAAGQRPAQDDLATIRQMLEPYYRLKIFLTEEDHNVAEQASEIVAMIKQEQTQQQVQFKAASRDTSSSADPMAVLPDDKYIIVASGGDGTVSAIAGATLHSGIPVGIVPRGTANAFSVALGIPTDSVESACRLILRRTLREVDGALLSAEVLYHDSLIEDEENFNYDASMDGSNNSQMHAKDTQVCNNCIMNPQAHPDIPHMAKCSRWINHAGLGFEAGLVDNATRELKDKFGNLAYTIGAAQQIFRDEQFRCTFVVDGDESTEKTVETNIFTIANVDPPTSIFAQGFGKVIPDDGYFEVTIGTASGLDGFRELATLMANALVQDKLGSDTILCFRCKEIKVKCDPPQKLLVDGEVIRDMDTVTFTCVHKGLKVIAPAIDKDG